MDFRLTTSTSFNQGEEDSGGEIDKFEVKLSRRKNWITVVMLVATSRSRLNYDFTTSKLMFLIQMALSGFQLTEWNKQSSAKEVMHRTQRDMFTCKALTHSHWVAPVHQQRRAQRQLKDVS
uniref:Uncharacterized protein n=1 Tax=Brassica oleracea var. oleracea TaxID=109376 RepID=A0A0D3B779_BRAOL